MAIRELGIIVHGATGPIASTQHLANALAPIIAEGGLDAGGGVTVMPNLILAGRNEAKLAGIARAANVDNWTTDLDAVLADDAYPDFFSMPPRPISACPCCGAPSMPASISMRKNRWPPAPATVSPSLRRARQRG